METLGRYCRSHAEALQCDDCHDAEDVKSDHADCKHEKRQPDYGEYERDLGTERGDRIEAQTNAR